MASVSASDVVRITSIPQTLEDFVALRDRIALTPEGGAVMMVVALMSFVQAPGADFGRAALTISVDRSRLTPDASGYKAWSLTTRDLQHIERQLGDKPWALRSYILGTSAEQGYALPDPPYGFEVTRNPYSGDEADGRVKVFLACSGAASPRPVAVQRNNRGIWKALEWSSLTVGVMPPLLGEDDDL